MVMHFALHIMKRIWYYQLWDGEERVPTHFMLGPLDMPNYAKNRQNPKATASLRSATARRHKIQQRHAFMYWANLRFDTNTACRSTAFIKLATLNKNKRKKNEEEELGSPIQRRIVTERPRIVGQNRNLGIGIVVEVEAH